MSDHFEHPLLRNMTTYRMKDGSLIYGEFSFVTELEFFDDADEVLEVVRERWLLYDGEVIEVPQRQVEWRAEIAAEIAAALDLDEYIELVLKERERRPAEAALADEVLGLRARLEDCEYHE